MRLEKAVEEALTLRGTAESIDDNEHLSNAALNRLTPIRVLAGSKNSRPVGFLL
jgi:hypothetical protein